MPVRKLLDVEPEAYSDGVGADSDNLMRFFWIVVQMSLVIFLSGYQNNKHRSYLYISYCGKFSEVYLKFSIFILQDFRKDGSFSLQLFQIKGMEEIKKA